MIKSINSAEAINLTNWLKKQRIDQKLSMRELAEKLGTPHSFVGKVEQRERRLDVIEFVTYCKALGVSPIEGMATVFKLHGKSR